MAFHSARSRIAICGPEIHVRWVIGRVWQRLGFPGERLGIWLGAVLGCAVSRETGPMPEFFEEYPLRWMFLVEGP